MKTYILCAMLVCGAFTASRCVAEPFNAEDIVKRLDPNTSVSKPGVRGSPWANGPGRKGVVEEEVAAPPSIDLNIPFDYNSDKLTPDGIMSLRNLGVALKDPRLANYRFKIAGHTDAKGTAGYNQDLSERRAQSVRDYLVFQYDVEATRIDVIGYGSQYLIDPANPISAINRRVQIVNIGLKQ